MIGHQASRYFLYRRCLAAVAGSSLHKVSGRSVGSLSGPGQAMLAGAPGGSPGFIPRRLFSMLVHTSSNPTAAVSQHRITLFSSHPSRGLLHVNRSAGSLESGFDTAGHPTALGERTAGKPSGPTG